MNMRILEPDWFKKVLNPPQSTSDYSWVALSRPERKLLKALATGTHRHRLVDLPALKAKPRTALGRLIGLGFAQLCEWGTGYVVTDRGARYWEGQ